MPLSVQNAVNSWGNSHNTNGPRVWSGGEIAGAIAHVPQHLKDTFFHDRGNFEAVAVAHSPTEASYHWELLSWAERAHNGQQVGEPPAHFHVGNPNPPPPPDPEPVQQPDPEPPPVVQQQSDPEPPPVVQQQSDPEPPPVVQQPDPEPVVQQQTHQPANGPRVWSSGEVAGEIAHVPQHLKDTFFHDNANFESVAVAHDPALASYHWDLLSWAGRAHNGEAVGEPPARPSGSTGSQSAQSAQSAEPVLTASSTASSASTTAAATSPTRTTTPGGFTPPSGEITQEVITRVMAEVPSHLADTFFQDRPSFEAAAVAHDPAKAGYFWDLLSWAESAAQTLNGGAAPIGDAAANATGNATATDTATDTEAASAGTLAASFSPPTGPLTQSQIAQVVGELVPQNVIDAFWQGGVDQALAGYPADQQEAFRGALQWSERAAPWHATLDALPADLRAPIESSDWRGIEAALGARDPQTRAALQGQLEELFRRDFGLAVVHEQGLQGPVRDALLAGDGAALDVATAGLDQTTRQGLAQTNLDLALITAAVYVPADLRAQLLGGDLAGVLPQLEPGDAAAVERIVSRALGAASFDDAVGTTNANGTTSPGLSQGIDRASLDARLSDVGVPLDVRNAFFESPATFVQTLQNHPAGDHNAWWDALVDYERGDALLNGAASLPDPVAAALLGGSDAELEAAIQALPAEQHLGTRQQVAELVARDQRLALGRSIELGLPESVRQAFVDGDGFALTSALAVLPEGQQQQVADAAYSAGVAAALAGAAWLAPESSRAGIASGDVTALESLDPATRANVEDAIRSLTPTPQSPESTDGLSLLFPDRQAITRLVSEIPEPIREAYWDNPNLVERAVDSWNLSPDEATQAWQTLTLAERADAWHQGVDEIAGWWGDGLADALRSGDEAAMDQALAGLSGEAAEDVSSLFARDRRITLVQQMKLPVDIRSQFVNGDLESVKQWIEVQPENQQPGLFEQINGAAMQAALIGAAAQVPTGARAAFLAGDIPGAHASLAADVDPAVVDDAQRWAMEVGNPRAETELQDQFFALGGHFDDAVIRGDGDEGTQFSLRGDITGKLTVDGGNVNGDLNEVLLDESAQWVTAPEPTSHSNSFKIYRLDSDGEVAAEIQLTHIHEETLLDQTTTLIQQPEGFNFGRFFTDLAFGAVPILFPATAPFVAIASAGRTAIDGGNLFDIVGNTLVGLGGIARNPGLQTAGYVTRGVDDIASGDILGGVAQMAPALPEPASKIVQGGTGVVGGVLNRDPLEVLQGGVTIWGSQTDNELAVAQVQVGLDSAQLVSDIAGGTFGPSSLLGVAGSTVNLVRYEPEQPGVGPFRPGNVTIDPSVQIVDPNAPFGQPAPEEPTIVPPGTFTPENVTHFGPGQLGSLVPPNGSDTVPPNGTPGDFVTGDGGVLLPGTATVPGNGVQFGPFPADAELPDPNVLVDGDQVIFGDGDQVVFGDGDQTVGGLPDDGVLVAVDPSAGPIVLGGTTPADRFFRARDREGVDAAGRVLEGIIEAELGGGAKSYWELSDDTKRLIRTFIGMVGGDLPRPEGLGSADLVRNPMDVIRQLAEDSGWTIDPEALSIHDFRRLGLFEPHRLGGSLAQIRENELDGVWLESLVGPELTGGAPPRQRIQQASNGEYFVITVNPNTHAKTAFPLPNTGAAAEVVKNLEIDLSDSQKQELRDAGYNSFVDQYETFSQGDFARGTLHFINGLQGFLDFIDAVSGGGTFFRALRPRGSGRPPGGTIGGDPPPPDGPSNRPRNPGDGPSLESGYQGPRGPIPSPYVDGSRHHIHSVTADGRLNLQAIGTEPITLPSRALPGVQVDDAVVYEGNDYVVRAKNSGHFRLEAADASTLQASLSDMPNGIMVRLTDRPPSEYYQVREASDGSWIARQVDPDGQVVGDDFSIRPDQVRPRWEVLDDTLVGRDLAVDPGARYRADQNNQRNIRFEDIDAPEGLVIDSRRGFGNASVETIQTADQHAIITRMADEIATTEPGEEISINMLRFGTFKFSWSEGATDTADDARAAQAVIDATLDAAERGVKVTIVTTPLHPIRENVTPEAWARFQAQIDAGNIRLQDFTETPDLNLGDVFNHSKTIILLDQGRMLVSTAPVMDNQGKYDSTVEVSGDAVPLYAEYVDLLRTGTINERRGEVVDQLRENGVLVNDPITGRYNVAGAHFALINDATTNVDMMMSELVEPDTTRLLIERAREGISVNVTVRELDGVSRQLIQDAVRENPNLDLNIYVLEDKPYYHGNLVIADDTQVMVGTAYLWRNQQDNLTTVSYEMGVLMQGADAQEFIQQANDLREITGRGTRVE